MAPDEMKEENLPEEEKPEDTATSGTDTTTSETVSETPAAPAEMRAEEEIVEERIYTVPLRMAYWTGSRLRRSNRAVRILKQFVQRHMKPEGILLEKEVNERIWNRGIQKPPRRIRIRAAKNSENIVRVYLAEG